MRHVDSSVAIPFEDAEKPNTPYTFFDSGKNKIIVREPIPERHTPHAGVAQDPAVYSNVGFAVANYTIKKVKTLQDDRADVVYECDDFYNKIDHPAKHTKSSFSLVVAVRYNFGGDNYTTTFFDKPKIGE